MSLPAVFPFQLCNHRQADVAVLAYGGETGIVEIQIVQVLLKTLDQKIADGDTIGACRIDGLTVYAPLPVLLTDVSVLEKAACAAIVYSLREHTVEQAALHIHTQHVAAER